MTLAIAPFPVDLPASVALAEDALRARLAPGEQMAEMWPTMESAIRTGHASGGLLRSDGTTCGVVLWAPAGPLGTAIRLLYLVPRFAGPAGYRAALDVAERAAGPVAFAPGPLDGLTEAEERSLMGERGFAPYGRSEMVLPSSAVVPVCPAPPGVEVRPVRPADERALARLHERAYSNHFDRYLALEETDPTRDAEHQVHDYFAGRFGEVLVPGSSVAELDGGIVSAVVATRPRPAERALVIDVMTDPVRRGLGVGRAVLSSAVRALRERGESAIVLNVTEGNLPALSLYARLGFVRSMGPTREWYDARRIPGGFPYGRPA